MSLRDHASRLDKDPPPSQNKSVISEKFDSLSDEELFALAEKLGLDLPPDLDRLFVVEELCDALAEESAERRSVGEAPLHVEEKKFACSETEDLELSSPPPPAVRYSETMIRAIVRDPAWAFAFWDISDAERSFLRAEENESSLLLRVTEVGAEEECRKSSFDIPVAEDDLQWYINLPRPKARYRIDLCLRLGRPGPGGRIKVLARTGEVAVPRQVLDEGLDRFEPEAAELLRLSGLDSLHIEPPRDDNPQRILKFRPDGE